MRDRLFLFATLAGLALAMPAAAQPVNGSFEPDSPIGTYLAVPGGSTAIPGWEATDTGVEWFLPFSTGYANSPDGGYCLDLANLASPPGGVRQTFATVPGETYRISFFIGTVLALGRDGTCEIVVSADGTTRTFAYANLTANLVWSQRVFTFVADDVSATLSFRCLQNPAQHFANLDGVAVQMPSPQGSNGGFEPAAPFGPYQEVPGGSTTIPDWLAVDSGVEWFLPSATGSANSPDDGYCVDLANLTFDAGGVEQTFSTTPGASYFVHFYMGTQQRDGRTGTCQILATADGSDHVFSMVNPSATIAWSERVFAFVADNQTATLSFRCVQSAALHFAYLDGVLVELVTPPLDVSPAAIGTSLALGTVAPNPMRSGARVSLVVPGSDPADLELLDLAGRVVARFEVAQLPGRSQTIVLGNLEHVLPGVFFLRLRQGHGTAVRRVALAR